MQKIILSFFVLCSFLLAEVTNIEVSPKFVEAKNIKIIDIRTEVEWEEMGVISGAYLITFFHENKKEYTEDFIEALDKIVDKDEQFAIISNTASRTKLVSNFLGHKHNYNVINLIGGMSKLVKEGYKVKYYKSNKEEKNLAKIQSFEHNITITRR